MVCFWLESHRVNLCDPCQPLGLCTHSSLNLLRAGMTVQERGLVGTVDLLPGKWPFKDTVALRYSTEAEFVASRMEDGCPRFG